MLRRLAALLLLLAPAAAARADNLLRNGSFEGGTRYWYEADDHTLLNAGGHDGAHALRLENGKGVASAAFLLEQNRPVTLRFSARTVDGDGTMGWQLTPCAREVGVRHGLTWSMRARNPVEVGPEWRRYAFTFTPTVPTDGFWPRPTYMLQLGDCDRTVMIDAVSVGYGGEDEAYAPRTPIEVQALCPELKGYRADGNLLAKGQTVTLVAAAYNATRAPKRVTLRWEQVDYEGTRALNEKHERVVTIPPGATVAERHVAPLAATGTVLGRVSVVGDDSVVIDRSDIPLTALAYPTVATSADFRERFGGSLFGVHNTKLAQAIGLRWTRWKPKMEWGAHQPDGPDSFRWFDAELDDLVRHGFAAHFVMFHDQPKWAMGDDGHPLPKDMRWAADDARWDDLAVQCAWDRFVVAAVEHYRGRPLVYELDNEPEFDWAAPGHDALYAKFTKRTARLIKRTNPKAFVMVDNTYGIPSGLNRRMLEEGVGPFIDAFSWHDYHEGWLADAPALRRMKTDLARLGAPHAQIWFNEGWAFTNTVVDEPTHALTHHTSAQSTNATVCSVAELTANGQDKTVLFHTGYDGHGMSFWDYAGPGTMLWDYYGYPMPLAPAWNVLSHHVGLSEVAGFVRPTGANLCVFHDLRNGRGVVVAYADRGATADVLVELPFDGLVIEDAMGNARPLSGRTLTLSKTGRPVYLYRDATLTGTAMLKGVEALDRKHAAFADGRVYTLPGSWDGTRVDGADGNPALLDGRPVWRLDQVWPDDPTFARHYAPLVWNGASWSAARDGWGGQPEARVEAGAARLSGRASWTGQEGQRIAALVFVAPEAGRYRVTAKAHAEFWEGGPSARVPLGVFKKDAQRATREAGVDVPRGGAAALDATVALAAGHELALVPQMPDWHHAAHVTLADVRVERVE